jgi:hypothetical protein
MDSADGYALALDGNAGTDLRIRGRTFKLNGASTPSPEVTAVTNVINWNISAYTDTAGKSGEVNFNVEYTPFNLTTADDWKLAYTGQRVDTAFRGGIPTWIIRNGVNDEAPDGKTNFAAFGNADPAANANGGAGGITACAIILGVSHRETPRLGGGG